MRSGGTLRSCGGRLCNVVHSMRTATGRLKRHNLTVLGGCKLGIASFGKNDHSPLALLSHLIRKRVGRPSTAFVNLTSGLSNYFAGAISLNAQRVVKYTFRSNLGSYVGKVVSLFNGLATCGATHRVIHCCCALKVLASISHRVTTCQRRGGIVLVTSAARLLDGIVRNDSTPFVCRGANARISRCVVSRFRSADKVR